MRARLDHKTFLVLALGPLVIAACSVGVAQSGVTKEEARRLGGIDSEGNDICSSEGWYGDEQCDDFCADPDPDCAVSNCPDENDPRVTYRAGPGALACAQEIDFCGPDRVMFNSADCGCGCIEPDPGTSCGGFGGGGCPDGQFCEYAVEDQCGAADQPGTCAPLGGGCTKEYRPVCGCDGVTYGNACMARAQGASIAVGGSCEEPKVVCGGLHGIACPDGQFCNFAPGDMCGYADALGVCAPTGASCEHAVGQEVCGCDGATYNSECAANSAGVAIIAEGPCVEDG